MLHLLHRQPNTRIRTQNTCKCSATQNGGGEKRRRAEDEETKKKEVKKRVIAAPTDDGSVADRVAEQIRVKDFEKCGQYLYQAYVREDDGYQEHSQFQTELREVYSKFFPSVPFNNLMVGTRKAHNLVTRKIKETKRCQRPASVTHVLCMDDDGGNFEEEFVQQLSLEDETAWTGEGTKVSWCICAHHNYMF